MLYQRVRVISAWTRVGMFARIVEIDDDNYADIRYFICFVDGFRMEVTASQIEIL